LTVRYQQKLCVLIERSAIQHRLIGAFIEDFIMKNLLVVVLLEALICYIVIKNLSLSINCVVYKINLRFNCV